jgi:hypothetical protein
MKQLKNIRGVLALCAALYLIAFFCENSNKENIVGLTIAAIIVGGVLFLALRAKNRKATS